MLATAIRSTKAGTITRTISISFALAGRCEALVLEEQRSKRTEECYLLERLESDFGMAFTVRKCESGEEYDVCLNMPGGGHSCDCKWGTYKSHIKPCRHVEICLHAVRERLL